MAALPVARMPASLFKALGDGTTVLTANERAARSLRQNFNLAMLTDGRSRWRPANVLPLGSWLVNGWQRLLIEGAATETLLNAVQEHSLWRQIILGDRQGLQSVTVSTASAAALADLAARASHALWLAKGEARLEECNQGADGRAFVRWAREFDRRCSRGGYLSQAHLPAALLRRLEAFRRSLAGANLLLVDFDELPPACATLLQALEQVGTTVLHSTTGVAGTKAQSFAAEDDTAELKACARWLRQQLEQAPGRNIAVVVPALADRRATIERIFEAELPPPTATGVPVFEFSLGRSLAKTLAVQTALALLRWTLETLPLERVSALLLSPFFGGKGLEGSAAAEFDAFELRARTRLRPELMLAELIGALEHSGRRSRLANLLYRLRQMHAASEQAELPASFAAWTDRFRECLYAAGCTASTTADSAEFQLWQRWESALDSVATLDFDAEAPFGNALRPAPTGLEALAAIERVAQGTIFAAESQQAPVQVLGPLELGGVTFDGLWFLGADDLAWPAPATAQPLLPWRLQHELGLPGTDRARDLATALRLTARIAQSATEAVFSYSRTTADEQRRPSPLLQSLAFEPMAAWIADPEDTPLPLVTLLDQSELPRIPLGQPVAGGARILKLQAACGFRAFAELRLGSGGIEVRETGLDARDQGKIVHRTMEEFWRRIQDQQALKQLADAARANLLNECIDVALGRAHSLAETAWDSAYLAVQRRRLHDLLTPWLEVEAQRPAFAVLQQESGRRDVVIGNLTIGSLRADRIDETLGGLLILDYKTGEAKPAGWLSPRPEEPQLPLYATVMRGDASFHEPLAGVAFVELRAGESLRMNGMADNPQVLGSAAGARMSEASFAEQVESWREILTALANQFVLGDVRVNPKSYPSTCQHCHQRPVCRLKPEMLATYTLDDPDSDVDGGETFGEIDG